MRSMGKKIRVGQVEAIGVHTCITFRWWSSALALVAILLIGAGAMAQSTSRITLDEAIDLALKNSPPLKAARTQIDQNKAQEVTAGLRPNPILSWDSQYVPFFGSERESEKAPVLLAFRLRGSGTVAHPKTEKQLNPNVYRPFSKVFDKQGTE
jgi:outer membrane protein TolC